MKRVKVNGRRTDEFEKALELADESRREPQPLCRNREAEFAHYQTSPTKEEADALCTDDDGNDCPLRSLCKVSALIERPAWGVRGGIAWEMGRQAHWVKAFRDSREKVAA